MTLKLNAYAACFRGKIKIGSSENYTYDLRLNVRMQIGKKGHRF